MWRPPPRGPAEHLLFQAPGPPLPFGPRGEQHTIASRLLTAVKGSLLQRGVLLGLLKPRVTKGTCRLLCPRAPLTSRLPAALQPAPRPSQYHTSLVRPGPAVSPGARPACRPPWGGGLGARGGRRRAEGGNAAAGGAVRAAATGRQHHRCCSDPCAWVRSVGAPGAPPQPLSCRAGPRGPGRAGRGLRRGPCCVGAASPPAGRTGAPRAAASGGRGGVPGMSRASRARPERWGEWVRGTAGWERPSTRPSPLAAPALSGCARAPPPPSPPCARGPRVARPALNAEMGLCERPSPARAPRGPPSPPARPPRPGPSPVRTPQPGPSPRTPGPAPALISIAAARRAGRRGGEGRGLGNEWGPGLWRREKKDRQTDARRTVGRTAPQKNAPDGLGGLPAGGGAAPGDGAGVCGVGPRDPAPRGFAPEEGAVAEVPRRATVPSRGLRPRIPAWGSFPSCPRRGPPFPFFKALVDAAFSPRAKRASGASAFRSPGQIRDRQLDGSPAVLTGLCQARKLSDPGHGHLGWSVHTAAPGEEADAPQGSTLPALLSASHRAAWPGFLLFLLERKAAQGLSQSNVSFRRENL
uniref:collagen alpha-1(I) chain n=1 Tax=Callithrix jacchus TaxID=9483 RepID=UPI0023DCEE41|nr:collagen alpha-1(I) chain [Callithrix jacchus]